MSELNILCYITNITILLLIGVLFAIIPLITRKNFLFGVRVPIEQQSHPTALVLKKRYLRGIVIATFISLVLATAQFLLYERWCIIAVMYLPFVMVIAQFAVYIPCWRKAKSLKKSEGWNVPQIAAADTRSAYANEKMKSIPWGYYIISLIAVFACIIAGFAVYPELPDMIPTHYDINMEPDAWSEKSIWVILLIPLFMLLMLATMVVTAMVFARTKLQINPQNPVLSFAQNKAYRRGMQHCLGILTLCITAMFILLFIPVVMPGTTTPSAPFWILVIGMCVPLIVFQVRAGQGGCKLNPKIDEEEPDISGNAVPVVKGRNDDEHWFLGMFYYNKNDPAIMVEDRFGANIGFNYARLPAQITTGILAIGTIVLYVWITVIFI